ncbi:MAG: hypothetical protein EBZ83_06060 [Verrucomicrobia bacterium]|nr:hypothetical protein [Verrucomicrobiota bacterium]
MINPAASVSERSARTALPNSSWAASWVRLQVWFQKQHRILPWRSEPTVYRVWISEIMLQQTQVITVLPYFDRFMDRFPELSDLAQSPVEEDAKAGVLQRRPALMKKIGGDGLLPLQGGVGF